MKRTGVIRGAVLAALLSSAAQAEPPDFLEISCVASPVCGEGACAATAMVEYISVSFDWTDATARVFWAGQEIDLVHRQAEPSYDILSYQSPPRDTPEPGLSLFVIASGRSVQATIDVQETAAGLGTGTSTGTGTGTGPSMGTGQVSLTNCTASR